MKIKGGELKTEPLDNLVGVGRTPGLSELEKFGRKFL
jgi:hypothetical protein